jgi:hypothetical protein
VLKQIFINGMISTKGLFGIFSEIHFDGWFYIIFVVTSSILSSVSRSFAHLDALRLDVDDMYELLHPFI